MKTQQSDVRMSPRYIQNMLMFKSFLTKTKPTFNPVMVRIYGKLNAERELFNSQERKQHSQKKVVKKPKKNPDDRVLSLIHRDFERETKSIKKLENNTVRSEVIKKSIHSQLINANMDSMTNVLNQEFDYKLTPSYCELLNTIQPEMSFKNKLSLREPLVKAKALLSQKDEKKRIYETQLRHEREFFRQPTMTDLPNMGKKRTTIKSLFENTLFQSGAKKFINSINEHCKSESNECCKILHKCSKAQGRFNTHYEELLDNYYAQL